VQHPAARGSRMQPAEDLDMRLNGGGGVDWQAPRTAYLLTAHVALREKPEAEKLWSSLDKLVQGDVLLALGAQCRLNMQAAMRVRGKHVGDMTLASTAQRLCENAFHALRALVNDTLGPWEVPECSHCRELVGSTLAALSLHGATLQGISQEQFGAACMSFAAVYPETQDASV
jgi:hypothetical protein